MRERHDLESEPARDPGLRFLLWVFRRSPPEELL